MKFGWVTKKLWHYTPGEAVYYLFKNNLPRVISCGFRHITLNILIFYLPIKVDLYLNRVTQ